MTLEDLEKKRLKQRCFYTKLEIIDILTSVSLKVEVDELPETGIENYLYLIPVPDQEGYYQLWIWEDGDWQYLGDSDVNFTDYITEPEFEIRVHKLLMSDHLSFYTSAACLVEIYKRDDTLNEDYSNETPIKTYTYEPNTKVSLTIAEDLHFEIINPHNSINIIYSWPRTCDKFYNWFMSVSLFHDMIFNFNKMDHSAWEHASNNPSTYKFGVVEAQYRNCVFWWDVACTNTNVHCYMLHKTQECPLFYSTNPANTYKALIEPYNITVNPNWTNPAFLDSFATASGRNALAYSQVKSVPFGSAQDADVITNIITLPSDCRTFMAWSLALDTATFDCKNVTNFGYEESGSYIYWNAFYLCTELRHLMLKNLKINVDLSWSPISNMSLDYIISNAANTSAITIKISPYTYYNLTDAIKTAAQNHNITLTLDATRNVDLKIWNTAINLADVATSGDYNDLINTPVNIESITYSELKNKRDNSQLVPGQRYRITDYQCTTTQENTRSAGHQFDIIVLALSENKLSEECLAIRNENNLFDVTFMDNVTKKCWIYFDGSHYNIVEDKTQLGDNSLTSGDVTIDFSAKTAQCPTLNSTSLTTSNLSYNNDYFKNSNLSAWKLWYCLDNNKTMYHWADTTNGKGVIYRMIDEWNNDCPYDFKNIQYIRRIDSSSNYDIYEENLTGTDTWVYTFDANIAGTHSDNSLGLYVFSRMLTLCGDNKINNCYDYSNVAEVIAGIRGEMRLNDIVFLGYASSLTYIQGLFMIYNTFGVCTNHCTLKGYTYGNKIEGFVQDIYLGEACTSNVIGSESYSIIILNGCGNNTIGMDCNNLELSMECTDNTFGNHCGNIKLLNNCYGNTFGNEAHHIYFGAYCSANIIGNNCIYITFGPSDSNLKSGYAYINIENGVRYVHLTSTLTTDEVNKLRYITISQGVSGDSSSWVTISHDTVNDTIQTIYRPTNSQVISV